MCCTKLRNVDDRRCLDPRFQDARDTIKGVEEGAGEDVGDQRALVEVNSGEEDGKADHVGGEEDVVVGVAHVGGGEDVD